MAPPGTGRRWPHLLVVALLIAALAGGASAQDAGPGPGPGRWELSMGGAASTPLLSDGNGTRVRSSLAPVVAARMAFGSPRADGVGAGLTIRGMRGDLGLRDGDERWDGGTLWQVDVMADAAWRHGIARAGGAAGATWLHSARGVAPLERSRVVAAGEVSLGLNPSPASPWSGILTLQGYRLPVRDGAAGGVLRAIVGVARAF